MDHQVRPKRLASALPRISQMEVDNNPQPLNTMAPESMYRDSQASDLPNFTKLPAINTGRRIIHGSQSMIEDLPSFDMKHDPNNGNTEAIEVDGGDVSSETISEQ